MRFTLKITGGNEAMQTPFDVAAALQTVATRLQAGFVGGKVMDANGNSVGTWSLDR